jgi:hypothetical protein
MFRDHFWPNRDQLLLLKFCLLDDDGAARAAWKEWKTRVDLDDLDAGSLRILSLVYRRLVDLQIEDPDLQRIKGIHRYQWTRNQLAWRGKAELLRALQAQGIDTLLLKGAALGQTVYPEPTARGMHDLDFLVPIANAPAAIELLQARGWIAHHFDPVATIDLFHGLSFLHPDYGEVDLHWHVMRSHCRSERDAELWTAARPFTHEGLATKILCPADQLLHACEHGQHHSPVSALQWLVDATFVIRHSPAPFDWARLVDQARKFQLTLTVGSTLRYLRRHFEPSIPLEVIRDLARSHVGLVERAEFMLARRPQRNEHRLPHRIALAACHYLKLKRGAGWREIARGFPFYYRLLSHEKREWPVVYREWKITARTKWRDDREERCFRLKRFFRLQSWPHGGLITRFPLASLHGFYQVETELGSPYRWTQNDASILLPMRPATHTVRIELRPFRDLTRLLDDGLAFTINGHPVPSARIQQEGHFLSFFVDGAWLRTGHAQTLAWTIRPWPAPGDPRTFGLPLSRIWTYRGKPEREFALTARATD